MMEEKKYYSVDRLEGGFAVLLSDEDEPLTLPMEEIGACGPADGEEAPPAEAPVREEGTAPEEGAPVVPPAGTENKRPVREGDILVRVDGRWQRDDAEAARRRKKNAALLANLRRRSALK